MNNFYVYRHLDKNGRVFYIGKGKGRRAYDKNNRNVFWKTYVEYNNGEYIIEIIKSNLSEDEAYDLEINEIKNIGLNKLTNISPGGRFNSNIEYITQEELDCIVESFCDKNIDIIKSDNIYDRFNEYCIENKIKNETIIDKFRNK